MKIVHIQWIDSQADVGWQSLEEISQEQPLAHTVGILVTETQDSVVIAHSYDPSNEEWNGRIYIPIVSIVEVRTLCHVKT